MVIKITMMVMVDDDDGSDDDEENDAVEISPCLYTLVPVFNVSASKLYTTYVHIRRDSCYIFRCDNGNVAMDRRNVGFVRKTACV